MSFGWRYDFNGGLTKAGDMPDFLSAIRGRAEIFAGVAPGNLHQVLVTEYAPGAARGWHKDRSVFGDVVGISLLSPCTFRLRRNPATAGSGAISRQSRARSICCADPRGLSGSTVSPVCTASATRSPSVMFSKELGRNEPHIDIA